MKKEEVIKWLMIMKANLNSFPPEVSGVRKIEALAEAIRLLKNEQSEEPSSSEKPNKSEIPTSLDDCISRFSAKQIIRNHYCSIPSKVFKKIIEELDNISSATPIRPKMRWIDHSDEGYVECPICGSATNCDDNIADLHFCFSCGADMRKSED